VNGLEQAPLSEEMPDFGMEAFGMSENFDINAAFQEAIIGVASDNELALEEKVRRMEVIVSEGTSEVYRDFVDFRSMAAQMAMMCNHNHALNQSMQSSDTISSFIDSYMENDGHNHENSLPNQHGREDDDDEETDDKKKKKKKLKKGWLSSR